MDKEIKKDSVDIEGGPSKEPEVKLEDSKVDAPLADTSLDERTKKIEAREEAVESKLKEIGESQELFRKEWDEKSAEIDALKELSETPEEDLEDVDFSGDDDKKDETKVDPEPVAPTEGTDLNTGFEKTVEREIQDESKFRETVLKNQKVLNQKFAERELNEELDKAVIAYPKMDKREVLLEVQRDPSQDISKLAEKSEIDSKAREEVLKEKLKTELKKEADGVKEETEKTETIPSAPVSDSIPSRQEKSKDRWTQATKEAQVDLNEGP